MGKKLKINAPEILLALSLILVTILFTQEFLFTIDPVKELEFNLLDERFNRRGPIDIEGEPDVIVVEITQDSYDQIPSPYNSWPWPRSYYAKLIENLNEAGAKAIGIDIVLSTRDKFDENNDVMLMETLHNYSNVTLAGKIDIKNEALFESKGENSVGEGVGVVKKLNENFGNLFYSEELPVGIVQVAGDDDGIYRRYSPFVYSGVAEQRIPTFGFSVLNSFLGLKPHSTVEITDDYFILGNKQIPKFDRTSLLVNYYGINTYDKFRHFNFADIIDDKEFNTVDEIDFETEINTWDAEGYGLKYQDIFRDKIVLIGSTMPEDKDVLPVSISSGKRKGDNLMYGVEFHATAIQNILSEDYITTQSKFLEILSIFIAVLMAYFGSSFVRHSRLKNIFLIESSNTLIMVALVYGFYEFSMYLFINFNFVLFIIAPTLGLVLGYGGSTVFHFIRERKQSSAIKKMFSHYVSGVLVNQLIDNPDKLKLGGEKRNLTILFSDIAGFSTFSEQMGPEELVKLMNEYLNAMTDIVIQNRGTLDKYIGDAVMAFWGAPISLDNHAEMACVTALEMQEALDKLQESWKERNLPEINVRIGVNTGDVIVGNIGSRKRFDYTVMGDDVNLASRLEGANKQYGTFIMLNESTAGMVRDKFLLRDLDFIKVKGKNKPARVYELIGRRGETPAEEKLKKLSTYFDGLTEYRNRNFREAENLFLQTLENLPDDAPSKVYIERIAYYLESPPGEEWDGSFTMKSK
ncbi:MAG: adenylate/guanylate cyclase domain-containing protein [Melioribacteraceae bacterium]|nr:MAG: adenylate/guanylate cyclase domain-containing protein [Melioribacteraceae bacterium]